MRSERFAGGKRPIRRHPAPAPPPLDGDRITQELRRFLDATVREMNLALAYEISQPPASDENRASDVEVTVAFHGEDQDLLLERNAELLLAMEHIAHRWLRLDPRQHDRVRFDCGDYRASHLEELKLSARVAAQRVRETGQPFRFNPMTSRERRLIHLELSGASDVRTVSEGNGDHRQLVIYPATKK